MFKAFWKLRRGLMLMREGMLYLNLLLVVPLVGSLATTAGDGPSRRPADVRFLE
jgi:hypothetical protein